VIVRTSAAELFGDELVDQRRVEERTRQSPRQAQPVVADRLVLLAAATDEVVVDLRLVVDREIPAGDPEYAEPSIVIVALT
jgi:hypothetical protein